MVSPRLVNINNVLFDESSIQEPCVFVLDLSGPITKSDQICGPTGVTTKCNWLKMADAHENVFAHLLRIDSGGGEAYASNMMANTIHELNKPVYAFIEGFAASAAYWIASAAKTIAVSSAMDRVGSIGTYITIADFRQYYQKKGISLLDVYATKSKDKNRDYHDAIDGNTTLIQQVADKYNDFFLSAVRTNRGAVNESSWGTGKMFFADEAIRIGLVDRISTLENFIQLIYDQRHLSGLTQFNGARAEMCKTKTINELLYLANEKQDIFAIDILNALLTVEEKKNTPQI
jgi:signal peptide peptidase SppA